MLHENPHAPPAPHVAEAFVGALHVFEQEPHVTGNVRSVSHPLLASPSQSPHPVSHQNPHVPPGLQVADAWLGAGQAFVHDPHVAGTERSVSQPFVSSPSHEAKPASQTSSQVAMAQIAVAWSASAQAWAQPPQLAGSLATLVSQPFVSSPSQLSAPVLQAKPQAPVRQAGVAFGGAEEHAVLHPPQWLASASKSASQPLAGSPSQSPRLASHTKPHWPLRHVGLAYAGSAQLLAHEPQRVGSLSRSVSQPLAGLPSQSSQPAAHV